MEEKHDLFLRAIHERRIVKVTVNSNEKGIIVRMCIPFDFGPSRRYKDGANRYHFYDLDSPDGSHNLSILDEQLLEIEHAMDSFEPGDYITWQPKWFVKRDWGSYS